VRSRLVGPEVAALNAYHLSPGQNSPLSEIIAGVTGEVRGRVSSCSRNTLGAAGTIPSELTHAALTLITWRLIARLPDNENLINEARRKDYEDAQSLLRDVASCAYSIGDSNPAISDCTAGAYGGDLAIDFIV
jgi:hypothetical protein